MGLRPSEACQLRGVDVGTEEGISYVKITDAGMRMRVKSPYALRKVPLHDVLLELGFHDFVRSRRHQTHLFGYIPSNTDGDWSKPYLQQFSRVLDALGWKAGSRVTSYGLRHTFVDELKRAGAQEHDVADLVGHATQSLTYGRYGKHATLSVLQKAINLFHFEGGQAHENA